MTAWRRFRLAFSMSNYSRLTLLLLLAMVLDYAGAASGWVEHVSIPGPDAPGTGQSHFDDPLIVTSLDNMVRKNPQPQGTDYQHLPPCLARANE